MQESNDCEVYESGVPEVVELVPGVRGSRDVDTTISETLGCFLHEWGSFDFEWTTLYDEYIYLLGGGPVRIDTHEETVDIIALSAVRSNR